MLEMFDAALDEVETNYAGMVIATEAKHFSVGLNLILLLERAKNQDWDAISGNTPQTANCLHKTPYGIKTRCRSNSGYGTRGAGANSHSVLIGCKLLLKVPSVSLNSASDSFRGGGGTKEMALRCLEGKTLPAPIQSLFLSVNKAFDTLRESTVSQKRCKCRRTRLSPSHRCCLIRPRDTP